MIDSTVSNLEMIGSIKKNEYMQADKDNNIISFLEQAVMRCSNSEQKDNIIKNTILPIRYTCRDELPPMVDNMLLLKSDDDLKKVGALLEKSILGITNLQSVFQDSVAFTDELADIRDNYCKKKLNLIYEYFKFI